MRARCVVPMSRPGERVTGEIDRSCRFRRRAAECEQPPELGGVALRLVPVAVVEQDMYPPRPGRELADGPDELLQLFRRVQVVESLRRRGQPLLFPGVAVAAVQAQQRELRAGDLPHLRNAGRKALRLVDDDVGEAVIALEGERPIARLLAEPGLVAEFDGDLDAFQHLRALRDVVQALAPEHELGRELKEHRSELARAPQRLEGGTEPPPQLVLDLGAQVPVIKARTRAGAERLAQIGRQRGGLRPMAP